MPEFIGWRGPVFALACLLIAGQTVRAAPLAGEDYEEVLRLMFQAERALMLARMEPDDERSAMPRGHVSKARAFCEKAEMRASGFDRDRYVAGVVEKCFGDVREVEVLQHRKKACTRYAAALKRFSAATSAPRTADAISTVRKKSRELGC